MPKFYVTYGIGSNLGNNYSVVEAEDYEKAREEIHKITLGEFAFVYEHDEFEGQAEEYDLTEVPLQAQVMYDRYTNTLGTNMQTIAKNLQFTLHHYSFNCDVVVGVYPSSERPAIILMDPVSDELLTVASVNLPDDETPQGHVASKNWSENQGLWEQLEKVTDEDGMPLFLPTSIIIPTGFVESRLYLLGPTSMEAFEKALKEYVGN